MHVAARLSSYYFAFFAHAGAYVSYFSLYLVGLGLAAHEVAFALAMPQAARIVAPALWAWLADAWGERYPGARRAIVVFSALAMLAGFCAIFFQRSAGAIALTLLLLSFFSAGAAPLVEAITFSVLKGGIGQYGPIRLWGSVGFILAVLGTGAWLDYHDTSSLIVIAIALTCVLCVVSPAIPAGAAPQVHHGGERFAAVLRRSDVLAFFGACFCMTAAHGTMYVFYSIYLEQAGYSKTLIGMLWTLGVLAEILLFLRLPQLLRLVSLRTLLLASFVCAVARFPVIGWGVHDLWLLAAAQLLHAATFGAFHSGCVAAVHRLFPGQQAARGQALYSSIAYGLGGAVGSLVAGATWESLGAEASFAISALFALCGAALVAWKVRV